MNNNLFILDDKYNSLLNTDLKELSSLVKNKSDIILGNYVFSIFKNINLDKKEYEIFSLNPNKKFDENLLKILNITENNICFYDQKIYIKEELKNTLDLIIKNKFSDDYIKFLLESHQKQHYDIYDYIKKLDMVNFNKVYIYQYDLIKYINKPFYPINYCNYLLNEYQNKIARQIIMNMFNLLKNFEYEIHPKILDLDNYEIYEDISNCDYNNLHDLLVNLINKSDFSLFARCINIFKLNYKNSDFIFILKNEKDKIDEILKFIKESDIYEKKDYLELLLILNKVNLFHLEYNPESNIEINFDNIIYYLNKYHSDISFYYLLDKYFDKININCVLSIDFTKIYLNFISKSDNLNYYVVKYFKLLKNDNNNDHIYKLLIDSLNKDKLELSDVEELINNFINHNNKNVKELLKINKIKYIIKKPNFLFKILDNKDENLFYFIKNLFEEVEFYKIINELKDEEGNSIYHYICKNNICLGYNINNKLRNNKGYRPLDLCQISSKYYKI